MINHKVQQTVLLPLLCASLSLSVILSGCGNQPVNGPTDTIKTGTIHISVDESFKPIIDSQIKVFESSFPDAKIIADYKAEADCLKDLNNDSVRMVIVTRELTEQEEQVLKAKLSFIPRQSKMASDAIAVIVNKASNDTTFDMADIRSLVKGTSGYKYKVVLDGLSATSTVRFVVDSLAKGQPLGKNVVAATSSQGVIDYISNNTDAIGFVGVSWIGNPEDSAQSSFLKKGENSFAGVHYLRSPGLHTTFSVQYRYPSLSFGAGIVLYFKGKL